MIRVILWVLLLLIPAIAFSAGGIVPVINPIIGNTICFRVDISSFTQPQLDNFVTMGRTNDPDIFRQTYLLSASSYYLTLKITPKDPIELNQLMAFVGNGFDVWGIYNLSGGALDVRADNTANFSIIKSTPAIGPKPSVIPK